MPAPAARRGGATSARPDRGRPRRIRGEPVPLAHPTTGRERHVGPKTNAVLQECRVIFRPQPLRIVEPREGRERRQARQQIRQRASGKGAGKRQCAARQHITKRVLLNEPAVEPRSDEMIAPSPGERVRDLQRVGRAVLGVVVLRSDRRKTAHGDEAQSRVSRVGPRLGQPHSAIRRAVALWAHAGRHPVQPDQSSPPDRRADPAISHRHGHAISAAKPADSVTRNGLLCLVVIRRWLSAWPISSSFG